MKCWLAFSSVTQMYLKCQNQPEWVTWVTWEPQPLATSYIFHTVICWLYHGRHCLRHHHHQDDKMQVRRTEQEADLRPVTPSKIPVGAFRFPLSSEVSTFSWLYLWNSRMLSKVIIVILARVEEEKAINRALNSSGIPLPTNHNDSNRQKSPPPAPVSRFQKITF